MFFISRWCATFSLLGAAQIGVAQPQTAPMMNAASPQFGARVRLETGPNVGRDKNTDASALLDGNAHSRAVVTGAPYSIFITLPQPVQVEKIALAHSDYDKEAAPKDVEISFDNGPKISHTLALSRPIKRKIAWQEIGVGRAVKSVQITVLSNHEGTVKWGGLADIALWTNADMPSMFRISNHDPKSPTFIRAKAVAATAPIKITLPPLAKANEFPRLLFTPNELKTLRAELQQSERGRATLAAFLKIAEGTVQGTPNFPDPKGPGAQLKDRGDALAQRHGALSRRAGTLGMAYALTGEKRFADAASEILRGYARLYEQYPEHRGANAQDSSKVMAQRLSEAMWLIPQLTAYDFIADTLSEADKKQIETGLIRPALAMIRRQKSGADETRARDAKNANWRTAMPVKGKGANNWVIFYNLATMMAGSLLNDRDFLDLASADLRELLVSGIGEDGLWGEGAIGYQMFALGALVPGMEVAARQGIDLWSFDNSRVKQLFDSPLRYAYPDGTMPGINDSSRATLGNWSTMIYDYAFLRFGDATYANLINQSPRQLHSSDAVYAPTRIYQTLPPAPIAAGASTLFGDLGYGILRNANSYALLDYGPHGGVHGHFDKLNLLLFARGERGQDEMGGEPQMHRYEDALHGQWTTQTIAHNTLTVDEQSQLAGTGRLLLWEDTPDVKVMRAESSASYPGVLLDRTVLVMPDAVVDLFHGRSALDHNWDRTFRFAGQLDDAPTGAAKPLGSDNGLQHIQIGAQKPAAEGWRGTWQTKAGAWNVHLSGAPTQQAMVGTGPDKDHLMVARQNGKSADFGAVYALDSWKNPVQSTRWKTRDERRAVWEMTQQDGTTTRVVVAHKVGEWEAEGWKSDARVLVLKTKGTQTQVLLAGGSWVENGALKYRGSHTLLRSRDGKLETVTNWTP